MPELPEVETIVNDLRPEIIGKTIIEINCITASTWRNKIPENKMMIGSKINSIGRKGKNILIYLSNNKVLIFHLKMTGRLIFESELSPLTKHTHFIMTFNNGFLRFNDIRKFGYIDLIEVNNLETTEYLSKLGPDALAISKIDFIRLIKSKNRIIKSLLLDQTIIAGIGNIYSDEALFAAKINPLAVCSKLSEEKAGLLHKAIISTLKKAIKSRGSSVSDYVDGSGKPGGFQYHLKVYGREGEPCYVCGKPIKRSKIGSRSGHFCSHCQKMK
jgi:formamidopyrimidine-DNA glycosylase